MGPHQLDFGYTSSPPPLLMTFVSLLATASHFHRHDYEHALHLGALITAYCYWELGLIGFRVLGSFSWYNIRWASLRTPCLDHLRLNGEFCPLRT